MAGHKDGAPAKDAVEFWVRRQKKSADPDDDDPDDDGKWET
jgi:hypothetical protein